MTIGNVLRTNHEEGDDELVERQRQEERKRGPTARARTVAAIR